MKGNSKPYRGPGSNYKERQKQKANYLKTKPLMNRIEKRNEDSAAGRIIKKNLNSQHKTRMKKINERNYRQEKEAFKKRILLKESIKQNTRPTGGDDIFSNDLGTYAKRAKMLGKPLNV